MTTTDYKYYDHDNEAEALEVLKRISKMKRINYDSETTGLQPENLNERLRLAQFGNKSQQHLFDIWRVSDRVKAAIASILSSTKIEKVIHNAVFDIEFARADLNVLRFGKVWCTMLAEEIISCGNTHYGFSLDDVTYRHLEHGLSKEMQLSDWSRPQLTPEQLEYAARDVSELSLIADKQKIILEQDGTLEVALREFACAETVAAMQLNGFYVDPAEWQENTDRAKEQINIVGAELCKMLAPEVRTLFDMPTINLGSTPEITRRLKAIGVKLPEVNGKTTTDKTKLKNMRVKPPEIVKLLEYRESKTHVEKYGDKWLTFRSTTTGRLHSSYRMNGAKTGRFSDSKPPKQQIKKDGTTRNCFKAQKYGWSLTWADFSQFELRALAETVFIYTGDTKMIEAFERGEDYHQWTAAGIFDIPMEEAMLDQYRNPSKNMNFLIVYGGGKYKLAENVQISVERAGWIIDRMFEVNPALKETLDRLGKEGVRNKVSKTLGGRLLKHYFNEYDGKEKSRVERISKNMPIQGINADVMKVAMRLHHDHIAETEVKLVHIVHDEMIDEHPDAMTQTARKWIHDDMVTAGKMFLHRCPVKVEVKTGKFWSK